ncbi:MAG: hypothetical protein UY77_C0009G0025 [Candidatus Uhrbacteria bacterium GW2011_GWA2_53_10]|uniref:Uncharacterized protein n=1 Tax=Candidatus Uhrbacteria bacterium GW2011_GWA2_53_10 TaxID=1618980 RepID=A0A0G1ZX26_9BACT|nr:MAG: hypothetical protein UY77_C0009G0025 [Candidatus Uhrbacteria bacterium GW2011_GWA2_53_10]
MDESAGARHEEDDRGDRRTALRERVRRSELPEPRRPHGGERHGALGGLGRDGHDDRCVRGRRGAVDPLYAGQVAGALQYLDYSARAVGSPTVIDPLQLQLLQHRVGAVEGRVEKAEAKGAAVLEAIGEAAK